MSGNLQKDFVAERNNSLVVVLKEKVRFAVKRFWVLIAGLAILFTPLCIQGEESPEDREGKVITAEGKRSVYDDSEFHYGRFGAAGGREGKVLKGSDCDIDCTNAVLGGDCDIDCTSAEHGTDY